MTAQDTAGAIVLLLTFAALAFLSAVLGGLI